MAHDTAGCLCTQVPCTALFTGIIPVVTHVFLPPTFVTFLKIATTGSPRLIRITLQTKSISLCVFWLKHTNHVFFTVMYTLPFTRLQLFQNFWNEMFWCWICDLFWVQFDVDMWVLIVHCKDNCIFIEMVPVLINWCGT